MIYATTRLEADIRLRAHINGNMRGRLYQDGRWMLPISAEPKDGCNRDELIKQSRYCFKAGNKIFKSSDGKIGSSSLLNLLIPNSANDLQVMEG